MTVQFSLFGPSSFWPCAFSLRNSPITTIQLLNIFLENSIEKKKRRTGKTVRMHHDWRLFDACRTGDENELLGLLQDGVNPNLRGTNSKINDSHTLKLNHFLECFVNWKFWNFEFVKGSKNITPLHVAARYDQVRIALYLLRNGKLKVQLGSKGSKYLETI